MTKLSAAGRLVLLMVDSPNVNVSYQGGPFGASCIASPVRGHGTMSNPRADTVAKLLDVGALDGSGAHLTLTDRGRTVLREEQAKGWRLVTEKGRKPQAAQD